MPRTIVATFQNLSVAQQARTVLDEAGVGSELGGDGATTLNPFGPILSRGSVHLIVDEERTKEAAALLRTAGYVGAVDRAEADASSPHRNTGPQHVRFAGLLVIGMAILLWLSRQDPAAWLLIGIGLVLAAVGHVGVVRARRRTEATSETSDRVREQRIEGDH